ncbi:MAG: peptidyl-prolyl cis-trans isomerase B (cyclophilin B) [Pseudohongiellaceae bacterium]|jgi:peptidyl-prolyl cis-trans isomerase B (cyclophilin B)
MKSTALLALSVALIAASCSPPTTYEVGQIQTPMGELLIWLYDDTPKHKEAFLELAESGYWDTYTFNRVIDEFVAQGGCPDVPEGFAYSVHLIEPEFEAGHKHIYGAFGAGRDDNPAKLAAACQFYVVQNQEGLARLDDNYMIYGHVFKGMDVVDALVKVETDDSDKPLVDIPVDVNVILMTQAEIEAFGFQLPL